MKSVTIKNTFLRKDKEYVLKKSFLLLLTLKKKYRIFFKKKIIIIILSYRTIFFIKGITDD